ncbi:uncharacterized protein PHACADRAFT_257678 [Phanerochaete carnosa HHB-10118-sp]|uniref:Uncharacterized protein n=1 Tax=Phanerochaete carnosa (strain HHB-10118-sp) TaxID=650164 RepID=K5UVL6_PHACS|nr:uncharacterized protein PHACADRAFT_257678 [Phanerochaete carnosa HHB-10118-sp]EKM54076.1 hypothetical protein PHACADRAFT_257678 [Phanerochaete carnosa HHB-10118-sp]
MRKLIIDKSLIERHTPPAHRQLPADTKVAHVDAFEADWSSSSDTVFNFLLFQCYVDFTSLRVLTLHGPLCDGPVTLLLHVPLALEELKYHATGSSPSIGTCTNLRIVTPVGKLLIEHDGPSEWLDIIRDLHAVPAPKVRDVGIVLRVYEDPYWVRQGHVTPADVPFEHLRRSLADQDWARLAACLPRFTALQTFRLEMGLHSFSRYDGRLSDDVPRCIRIMREVVAESPPQVIVAVTKVDAFTR